jgi:uridine kinase
MSTIKGDPTMIPAVCIDGPGGGGKSTFSEALTRHYGCSPATQLIHTDWYFEKWPEEDQDPANPTPGYFNSDRFMSEVGEPLMKGGNIAVREYVHRSDGGVEYVEHTPPNSTPLVVVEGIKTIALPIDWMVKVWVDTPRGVRMQRFLERPTANRRVGIEDQEVLLKAFNHWADDAEAYEKTIQPHQREDIIVISGLAGIEDQLKSLDEQYWSGPNIVSYHYSWDGLADE